MIGEFYHPFHETGDATLKNSERNSGQRILGTDPVSGETVSVRIGRFGPMAQIGEGEHVRYAGLLKGQLMETITLEEALGLFKFQMCIRDRFSFALIFCGAIGNIFDSLFYGMIFNDSHYQIASLFPEGGGYSSFLHGRVVDMLYFPLIEGTIPGWVPVWGGERCV